MRKLLITALGVSLSLVSLSVMAKPTQLKEVYPSDYQCGTIDASAKSDYSYYCKTTQFYTINTGMGFITNVIKDYLRSDQLPAIHCHFVPEAGHVNTFFVKNGAVNGLSYRGKKLIKDQYNNVVAWDLSKPYDNADIHGHSGFYVPIGGTDYTTKAQIQCDFNAAS